MAAPRNRLGAHDGGRLLRGHFDESFQCLLEGRRLHVVSKTTEGSVTASDIDRIGGRVAQAAQGLHESVVEAPMVQGLAEGFAIELRVVPRARNPTHIDQSFDTVRPQERYQLLKAPRRMPHRKNNWR